MILLVCSCLNIRIHGRDNVSHLQDVSSLELTDGVLSDPFFESKLYPVTLDLAGVTTSQKFLCKARCIENWIITTCACCMMDIFAKCIHNNDRVLVSSRAETNPNNISSLMNCEQYSSLFKLILPEINDSFIQNNIGIEFQNGNIHHSIEHVQNQVSGYLKDEQKAMEDRIRHFTEQQQSSYANILQKVRKNKQAMVYLMSKCKESQNQVDSEGDGMTESSVGSSTLSRDSANESSTSTDSVFDRSDTSDLNLEKTVKHLNLRSLRRVVSNPGRSRTKVKHELKRAPASIDVGGVFDMEEFETKENISYNSEEDITDESEDEAADDAIPDRTNEQFMCATSLPMSIPTLSNYPHFSHIEDNDEKEFNSNEPEDIVASMRALACSVRDGTEMFGELPRRRLNTGELLAFRPS